MTDLAPAERFGSAAAGAPRVEPATAVPPAPEPAPPRRRGVVAAVVGALLAGVLVGRLLADAPGPQVLVTTAAVPAGTPLRGLVRTVRMTHRPAGAVTSIAALSDRVARMPLAAGQVVTADVAVAEGELPAAGTVVVGLALSPGQAPATPLVAGDRVQLLTVPRSGSPGEPGVLVKETVVVAVRGLGDGVQQVSVAVGRSDASRVGTAAAAGTVAVVLLPRQ
jgi:hypothetical protein